MIWLWVFGILAAVGLTAGLERVCRRLGISPWTVIGTMMITGVVLIYVSVTHG